MSRDGHRYRREKNAILSVRKLANQAFSRAAGATRSTTSAKEFCDARPELAGAGALVFAGVFVTVGGGAGDSFRCSIPHEARVSKLRIRKSRRILKKIHFKFVLSCQSGAE